jgi:hypothetical protein
MVFSSQCTEHYHTKVAALPSDTQQSTLKTQSVIQHVHSEVTEIPCNSVNRQLTHGHSSSLGKAFCDLPVRKYITINGN